MNSNGISTVITIFLLMIVGFSMKKTKAIGKEGEKTITKIIQRYSIPALMIFNIKSKFSESFFKNIIHQFLLQLFAFYFV